MPEQLGSMPLLLRPLLVVLQDRVDHTLPRTRLRPPHRRLPLIPRRRRILQHLAHHFESKTEIQRRRPPAHPLHQHRPPHPCVQLHRLHASCIPQKTRIHSAPSQLRNLKRNLLVRETIAWRGGLLLLRHITLLTRRHVVYFCSGACNFRTRSKRLFSVSYAQTSRTGRIAQKSTFELLHRFRNSLSYIQKALWHDLQKGQIE